MFISGEQLRQARGWMGFSQTELASLVGVSLRTIGNWETGKIHVHPKYTAVLMAHLPPLKEHKDEVQQAKRKRDKAHGRRTIQKEIIEAQQHLIELQMLQIAHLVELLKETDE